MPTDLTEVEREKTFGDYGIEVQRDIPQIDLSDFRRRKPEISEQLWRAATEIGFFQLRNHGITDALIDSAFDASERFFALPKAIKSKYPLKPGSNAGWEYKSQIRPSTGTADQKESYQITLPRMAGLWPGGDELAGFKATMLAFERQNWALAMTVLSCFAERLGFAADTFTEGHDPLREEYQSTLRLLHYLDIQDVKPDDAKPDDAKPGDFGQWRASAHTDFDCLTLLHQRPGQGGLQLCPGKDAQGGELAWTDVPPDPDVVTCNIGDMLMRWSDDRLLSNLHRVRMPRPDEYTGPRYSIAFFAQANQDVMLCGPERKYEPISAHDYIQMRIGANFNNRAKPA